MVAKYDHCLGICSLRDEWKLCHQRASLVSVDLTFWLQVLILAMTYHCLSEIQLNYIILHIKHFYFSSASLCVLEWI